ncbi:MAG: type II secretion system protein GspE, partial [Pseudomonadota bacterium]
IGVYELMIVDEKLKSMIHDDASEQKMAAHAFRLNDTLAQSGFAHVRAGLTSTEEVIRVIRQEEADGNV